MFRMNQNQTTFLVNLQTFVPFGSLTQILPFRFSQLCGLEADESRTEYLGSAFLCYCSLSELSRAISCRAKQSGVRVQVYHDNANLVHSPADRDPVFESAQAWRLLRFNMWRATLEEKLHQQNVTLLAVTCTFLACRYLASASALPFHS